MGDWCRRTTVFASILLALSASTFSLSLVIDPRQEILEAANRGSTVVMGRLISLDSVGTYREPSLDALLQDATGKEATADSTERTTYRYVYSIEAVYSGEYVDSLLLLTEGKYGLFMWGSRDARLLIFLGCNNCDSAHHVVDMADYARFTAVKVSRAFQIARVILARRPFEGATRDERVLAQFYRDILTGK
jgi:hypothetical protein